MRRLSLLICAGIATLWLGGCGTDGGDTTVSQDPGQPVAVPIPSPSAATPDPNAAPAANGAPPAPPTTTVTVGQLPPDLIGSTDPAQRLREIQRNRTDPFAVIQTTPVVQIQDDQQQANQPPGPPASAPGSSAPGSPVGPSQGNPAAPVPPGSLAPIPQLVPTGPTPPPIPLPPPTDIARAVQVTGVVQIGSIPYAIVNAPNEASSRYVRVGQRLSNGQVLVKRIDMYQGGEPTVVLEQNGVEVVRAIGEGGGAQPATAEVPPAPPAAMAIASTSMTNQ